MVVTVQAAPKETHADRILRVLSDGRKRTAQEICEAIYDAPRSVIYARVDTIQATAAKMLKAGQIRAEKRHKMTVYYIGAA